MIRTLPESFAQIGFVIGGFTTLLSLLASAPARADSFFGQRFHTRTGPLFVTYSGPVTNTFVLPAAFDLEYERILSGNSSFAVRTIVGYDFSLARVMYSYAGLGYRHYIKSAATHFEQANEEALITVAPAIQYYLSGDLGISHVVVRTYGAVLEAGSALFDLAAGGGFIYPLSRSVGFEGHLGLSRGFGFSSVAVGEWNIRAFFGLTWSP